MPRVTTTIRLAEPDDAAALAELASRTFHDTFAAQNRPEDLEQYMATAYGEEQQRREIVDRRMVTLLAEVDGALAGFALLRGGEAPEFVRGATPIEIMRFYVDGRFHGRGIAQALMDAALAAARVRGHETVWLGVWEHNPRAIAFYVKCGFVDVGSHPFLLGSDLQTDRVMARPVG